MPEKPKALYGLSLALLASTALVTGTLVTGCTTGEDGGVSLFAWGDAGEAGESGEAGEPGGSAEAGESGDAGEAGEGGEAGEAEAADLSDDTDYLTQFGLMRGHLDVAMELYRTGNRADAAMHLEYLEHDFYTDLEPALEARGVPEFEEEMARLADGSEAKKPLDEIENAHAAVLMAIGEAEAVVAPPSPHEIGEIITRLVRRAAEDYAAAVEEDGSIAEAYEYQAALGFARTAAVWLAKLEATGAADDKVAAIREQLDLIKPAWPSLVPPAQAPVQPSLLYGAAARIEIATLKLKG